MGQIGVELIAFEAGNVVAHDEAPAERFVAGHEQAVAQLGQAGENKTHAVLGVHGEVADAGLRGHRCAGGVPR